MTSTSSIKLHEPHPMGLWLLSIVYAFYTLSFGMINSLLVLYVTQALHQSQDFAYGIFGGFNAILWTFPVLGGYLACQYGYRLMAVVGLVLCVVGAFLLSIPTAFMLYVALGIFVIGYGLSTTAMFSMVGFLYAKDDHRRDGGYTLYYLLFNFGFLLSGPIGGYLSTTVGYSVAFIVAGGAMILSLLIFILAVKEIKPYPGRQFSGVLPYKKSILPTLATVIFGSIAAALLLNYVTATNIIMCLMVAGSSIFIISLAVRQKNVLAASKLYAFIIIAFLALVFWSYYATEPSLLTLFIEKDVYRHVGRLAIPPSLYYSLDALYVIIFGIVLSQLWTFLGRRNRDLSMPTKMMMSAILVGLGFLVLYFSLDFANIKDHLINQGWIWLAYLLLAIAELFIAPIGMSMAGRLSPPGKEGVLMGIWTLFTGFSAIVGEFIGKWTEVPDSASVLQSEAIYRHSFLHLAITALVIGILSLGLVPKLKRLIKTN